jgi:hypothetical protein
VRAFSARERRAYAVINTCTAPLWLLMIALPRSPLTARAVRAATPLYAALGASYVGLLASGWGGERVDFRDPETVRRGLAQPRSFLAGWAHYIAFDLFVGRWIWEQGLAAHRSTRLALLLTWMAGPAGLTLWLGQSAVRPTVSRGRAPRR